MVTSSAVVGSSAIRMAGSHAIAIAIIERCSMPPENSKGYWRARFAASGILVADNSSMARSAAFLRRIAAVNDQRLGDLIADRHRGVQRRHRILKDHADFGAADVHAVDLLAPQDVGAAQPRLAGCDAARRHRDQSHDALHRHRFAATRFADDRQRFTGFDAEARAAHRVHGAAVRIELDVQVGDFEQRALIRDSSRANRARAALIRDSSSVRPAHRADRRRAG